MAANRTGEQLMPVHRRESDGTTLMEPVPSFSCVGAGQSCDELSSAWLAASQKKITNMTPGRLVATAHDSVNCPRRRRREKGVDRFATAPAKGQSTKPNLIY